MKAITKVYLKTFLVYGLLFGSMMTLWEYFETEEINIWKQIFQGSIFGVLMSWTTVTAQKRLLKNYGVNNNELSLKVRQSLSVENSIEIASLLKKLKEKDFSHNWKFRESKSDIIIRTKTSWRSWGENVSIKYDGDHIIIKSCPRIITTLFDFGQNGINVQNIKKTIEEYKEAYPAHGKN